MPTLSLFARTYALLFTALLLCTPAQAATKPSALKPLSPELTQRIVSMVEKPSTWERIPSHTTLCMYVPGGARGDLFRLSKAYLDQVPALVSGLKKHGVHISVVEKSPTEYTFKLRSDSLKREKTTQVKFRLYTNESVVAEDFRHKKCDGAAMSNMRARLFNPFVGSLDSIGAIPGDKELELAIQMLAKPQMQSYMKSQGTEVVAIMPLGPAYIFVNDRRINSVDRAAGKKVAVLSFDPAQEKMVANMGAQPVSADVTTFSGMFNNGQVDIIAAPAILFKPFELHKGMEKDGVVNGGIVRFPIMQLTAVSLIHADQYPEGFGQLIREISAQNSSIASGFARQSEAQIPNKYWFEIPKGDQVGYHKMMRDIRIQMTKDGFYDSKMMHLLKRVRCKLNPSNYECAMQGE